MEQWKGGWQTQMQRKSRHSGPITWSVLLPENSQTLAGTAFHPRSRKIREECVPGPSKFSGKLFPKRLWDSHSLLEFSDLK